MVYVDPNSLTPAQQIFSIFYAIFFGVMLSTIGAKTSIPDKEIKKDKKRKERWYEDTRVESPTLNLFDSPNAWAIGSLKFQNKPLWRFIISLCILNILPGFLFALIFNGLHEVSGQLGIEKIVILLWISLLPHYIYRVFYAFIVELMDKLYLRNDEHKQYNEYDLGARNSLIYNRRQFEGHRSSINHLAIPLFIVFPSYVLCYFYIISTEIPLIFSGVLLGWFVAGLLIFFLHPQRS